MTSREDSRLMPTGFFTEEEVSLSGEMMEYLAEESGHPISEPYYSYLRDHILICISRVRRKRFIAPGEEHALDAQPVQLSYARGLLAMLRRSWEVPDEGQSASAPWILWMVSKTLGE